MTDRRAAEDRLAEHWTATKATCPETRAEIAAVTGRPAPEADDALAHLTDEEVLAVHAAVCARCEIDGGGVDHHRPFVEGDMTMDAQRRATAVEEVMKTVGLRPEDLDGLAPEDRAHWLGRVEEVLATPAYALVYLGRSGAARLWPGTVAP